MAAAPAAASFRMSSAVRPPIMQKTPFSLVGTEPSTSRMYFPAEAFMTSALHFSAWWPAAAWRVSS